MDSIDITDSAFSLDNISAGGNTTDYTLYIYIGAVILLALVGMFVYKFYMNKRNTGNDESDCPGGFCTMNNVPTNNNN